MKKYYYLIFALLCCMICAFKVHAQSSGLPPSGKTVSDIENRMAYAVVSHNPLTQYAYGVCSFRTGSQKNIELMYEWRNDISIYCGAAAHGEYYGYFYKFDKMGPIAIALSKINLRSGEIRVVKDWSDMKVKFQDMTYDYSTNTMYAIGFDSETYLYTIDLKTGEVAQGALTRTLTEKQTLYTLAATYDGRLYGIAMNGILYQIDKETGNLTEVLDTDLPLSGMQSMEFDHTDECLYWASDLHDYKNPNIINELYKIDVTKKIIRSLGPLGGEGSQAVGLYIPFVLAGFDVPGQATEMKVVPGSEGKEEAVITWKNPVKTHGNADLTGNLNILLKRDGEVISSSLSEAGAEMSWTDKTVKQGEHVYTVVAINNKGEGANSDIDAYIGDDMPGSVELKVEPGTDCKSAILTWKMPEAGLHGGFYNKNSARFKIVRYPDNIVLEDNYEGTSYEDASMKRLGAYFYGITAINKAGKSNESMSQSGIIAGKALNLPYSCGFEDVNIAQNQWTPLDGNLDGNTWYINSGFSQVLFGDAAVAAEYIAETYGGYDADEWLITPPLNFEADKDYYISFDTRSGGVDELNITFGKLNSIESQTQIVKAALLTEEADDYRPVFQNHKFQLPKAEGVNCVGINLVTRWGDSQIFQINNIMIAEGDVTGMESATMDKSAKVVVDAGRLTVVGDFITADIYDTTGVRIALLSKDNAEISTENWKSGIYIVKLIGATIDNQKVVIK